MAQTNLHELSQLGQAVWLDFIQRSLIQSGSWKARDNVGQQNAHERWNEGMVRRHAHRTVLKNLSRERGL